MRVFTWLEPLATDHEGKMKKQDITAAVEELKKFKKFDHVLPTCFNLRNLEGFAKNLKQKGQNLCKECSFQLAFDS